ncbi:MAG: Sua5/YciO/YrdC/YwlC family protein, partial [Pseudomonadota bacterium]
MNKLNTHHTHLTIEDKNSVQQTVDKILSGAVVILPTETVYGLVCRADNAASVNNIYKLKGRDISKPLSIMT